jgi:hypothetical protein
MKSFLKITTAFLVVAVMAIGTSQATTIPLGTAANFAVLGGSEVTCANPATHITGDVGSSPTETVTGIDAGMVTGHLYLAGDSPTLKTQAHNDFITAYNTARDATGSGDEPANLGGATLIPGVYNYSAAATWSGVGTTLTLDGGGNPDAQWIFQIGTAMTTPEGATVALIGGASANNVFWQIDTLTLGGTNAFAGNILANTSITLGGGTLNGRALAGAAVTISSVETINIPEPATLCLLGFGALSLLQRKKRA